MLRPRRQIGGEVCPPPCNLRQDQAGDKWVSHTTTCPAWLRAHAHLFQPSPRVQDLGPDSGSIGQLEEDALNNIMRTPTESTTENLSTPVARPSTGGDNPSVLAMDGLRIVIHIPPRLRKPAPVIDVAPAGPEPLIPQPPESSSDLPIARTPNQPRIHLVLWHPTATNVFGMYRKYPRSLLNATAPQVPDADAPRDMVLYPTAAMLNRQHTRATLEEIIHPFPNISTFRLAYWFYTGGVQKSISDRTNLIRSVILAPDFSVEHFRGRNLLGLDRALDELDTEVSRPDYDGYPMLSTQDGWKSHTIEVSIPLPRFGRRGGALPGVVADSYDDHGHTLTIPGLRARSLVAVIRSFFSGPRDPNLGEIHFIPYQQWWSPGDGRPDERIYDELYTSEVWIKEHSALQRSPEVPGCKLERVIAAMMFWSDATHLAQFSDSSVWPVYLYFGNLSKFTRRKPLSRCAQHVAYFPKITGAIKGCIQDVLGGRSVTPAMLAHVKREAFQANWRTLLDDEFVRAHREGIKIVCSDGVERRIYPRIFTYSADYPEKTQIGCIRNNGEFPSPQTMVSKPNIHKLGTQEDRDARANRPRRYDSSHIENVREARRKIYYHGYAVGSDHVNEILAPTSSVPTLSAFSMRLDNVAPGYNPLQMLVPDLLHEFELGVWKDLLVHLMRLLDTRGQPAVTTFNARFRRISTYPPDTIRKFSFDVSEMVKFAARDYEDVLQCCIPCFEGLFTEEQFHRISAMVFTLAHWHALAKLRLHTASSLDALDKQTTLLGLRLRSFQQYCKVAFPSLLETNSEFDARKRRETRQALALGVLPGHFEKQPRALSLSTYKLHALGDYVRAIKMFGTTDSYSTQIGEREHRRAKARARRTNQNDVVQGIVTLERREARLHARAQALDLLNTPMTTQSDAPQATSRGQPHATVPVPDSELDEDISADDHHHLSRRGTTIRLINFFSAHRDDPAIKDFFPKLQAHLLGRLMGASRDPGADDDAYTGLEREKILFPTGSISQHATMRVNYTTYDVRRGQDILNPKFNHHFIMVSSGGGDSGHPFWYAKILGIYHADIVWLGDTTTRAPRRMEFVWVRWMNVVQAGSWEHCRLDRVAYVTDNSHQDAFGFIDPACIIRSVHMIPAFKFGRAANVVGHALALDDPKEGDWESYYAGRFVDRDMFMRYLGGGIGHFSRDMADVSGPIDDGNNGPEAIGEASSPPAQQGDDPDINDTSDYDEATEEDYDL